MAPALNLAGHQMSHECQLLGPSFQIGLQPGKRLANKAVTQLKSPDHYVVVDSVKGRTEVNQNKWANQHQRKEKRLLTLDIAQDSDTNEQYPVTTLIDHRTV